MRARLLIALALGAVLGGAAVLHLTGPRELEFPHVVVGVGTVRILVAKRELDYGTEIAPKDLQWVEWPRDAVPPGSFTSVEALLGEKGEGKRMVLRTIDPGEPVLESKITKLDESSPIERDLGDGRRAVQISVDTSVGVAGFVAPGDRVDIMLIREIEGQLVSSIIMQDVPVLAADGRPTEAGKERMITVDVDIAEAQKLALAQQVGRLALALRGVGDEEFQHEEEFRYRPPALEPCPRPWSGYRDIPENILHPDLCHAGLDGIIGPPLRPQGPPVRLRRGDFGVPRGLCDVPPNAPSGGTLCDVMDFPPWESAGPSVRVRRGGSLGETAGP